jgi:hypothetical protein
MIKEELMNPLFKETIVFRPLVEYRNSNLLRYNNDKWISDDGEPDLAFVDLNNAITYSVILPNYYNVIWSWHDFPLTLSIVGEEYKHEVRGWHSQTVNNTESEHWDDKDRDKHPNQIAHKSAMDKCCELHNCGSGNGVHLVSDGYDKPNPYFAKELVWIQRTMQPVTKPDKPVCYQCLNDGLLHKKEAFESLYSSLLYDLDDEQKRLNKLEIDVYDTQDEIERTNEKLTKMKLNPFYNLELENTND